MKNGRKIYVFVFSVLLSASAVTAQKWNVNSETGYSYEVPAHYSSTSNANANCYGSDTVNCSAHETTNAYAMGAHQIAYSVTGATFSLLLPDGRLAVVNCESKYRLKMDYINRRSCRTPLVNDVVAEF